MKKFAFMCVLLTSGCATEVVPLARPQGGFEAIRFNRTVEVRDHSINIYKFQAGTVLVADKQSNEGPVYCGPASIGNISGATCVGFRPPSTIVIGPGAGLKEAARPLDPQSFERIKVDSRDSVRPPPSGL